MHGNDVHEVLIVKCNEGFRSLDGGKFGYLGKLYEILENFLIFHSYFRKNKCTVMMSMKDLTFKT